VLAGAVAVPVALGSRSEPVSSGGSPGSVVITSPSSAPPSSDVPKATFAWPPPNVVAPHYTAVQLRKRGTEMQNHLKTQFPKVVPGATRVQPQAFQGEAAGDVNDGQNYLDAATFFTLNGAESTMVVEVFAPGAGIPRSNCGPELVQCDVLPQSDGSWVVFDKQDLGKASRPTGITLPPGAADAMRGQFIATARHFRNDGSVVAVSGYNYDMAGRGDPKLSDVPLTSAQLVALATDPALGL
jgi:hypothetical protein